MDSLAHLRIFMQPYYEENGIVIYNADCRDALKVLSDGSVDSVVCDPPYELGFMAKGWDRSGIAYDVSVWRECLRVLKPGGHLLAFGGSRTYHRLACAIEDAGFEIRDQIQWIYGSGFPKSLDVSKAIDAAAGVEREVIGVSAYSARRTQAAIKEGVFSNQGPNLSGPGSCDVTAPTTDAAKQWNGWGTALKPAHEPIVLARKPLIGTVAENVLQHGTGGLNIDGCRIGEGGDKTNGGCAGQSAFYSGGITQRAPVDQSIGRWPANVILDGSDEVLTAFPETETNAGVAMSNHKAGLFGVETQQGRVLSNGNGGSAARFFYCAKASKKDRGESNNHPTVKPADLMRYLCRLVTPSNGIVLDPFGGSGSTAKACRLEGFNCVLIEKELEYCELAVRRASMTHPGPYPKHGEKRLSQEPLNFEAVA